MTKEFKVAALSSNTNAFGLQQAVLIAKDGEAWKGCKNPQFMPKRGETVNIPFIKDKEGKPTESLSFAGMFEIPEKIETAPDEVIKEIWGEEIVS